MHNMARISRLDVPSSSEASGAAAKGCSMAVIQCESVRSSWRKREEGGRRRALRTHPFDARRLEQHREPLARIEHARLHRIEGDAEDLGDLLDRLSLVVDEIDDLAVLRRQGFQ